MFVSVSVYVCVCVCVCIDLSIYLSICLSIYLSIDIYIYVCLSACPSVRLNVCIHACMYINGCSFQQNLEHKWAKGDVVTGSQGADATSIAVGLLRRLEHLSVGDCKDLALQVS